MLQGFNVDKEDEETSYGFPYRVTDLEAVGRLVFSRNQLSAEEKERVQLVFLQAIINGREGGNLFVTADGALLRRRLWFESHIPGGRLNIVTLDEALEIMDLFAKRKGKYYVSSYLTANKGLWYWYSFRDKVPHYNVPVPEPSARTSIEAINARHIMEAFATRLVFLLVSVDEMGMQYYSGVNNDTMDTTMYHFNYFVALMSGIFDSLAIQAKNSLRLRFEGDNIPSRISLSQRAGREYLRALRQSNLALRRHINTNVDLINMTYLLRESTIHAEGFRTSAFEFNSNDARWRANFLRVPSEVPEMAIRCGDRALPLDPFSEWGVYLHASGPWLSPYHFAKAAAKRLTKFSDTFLEILGFPNFIQSLEPSAQFRRDIETFARDKLGW